MWLEALFLHLECLPRAYGVGAPVAHAPAPVADDDGTPPADDAGKEPAPE